MQPKQTAVPGNPIVYASTSITNTQYKNSAHIKAVGNNEDGKTNKRRIRIPNIRN